MRLTEDMMLKPLRTRDGHKAWVVEHVTTKPFPWIGCIIDRNGTPQAARWDYAGNYRNEHTEDSLDIIGEWKEPAKGEFWTNVYTTRNPSKHRYLAFHSKIEADDYGACNGMERIACIRTTWTEGQFDE